MLFARKLLKMNNTPISLNTLNEFSIQDIFDYAATHLLTQNEVSRSKHGGCDYRNPCGLKCVVGAFTSDDEYNSEYEGMVWRDLSTTMKLHVTDDRHDLMRRLQIIHDTRAPNDWPAALTMLAEDCKLNTAVINAHI